ncbi:hypothetical protein D9M70_589540 [compost metagenome]
MCTSRSKGALRVSSVPSSRIVPAVGASKPAIIRSTVVLPEPEGPSIEKNSPLAMSMSTWSTAVTLPNVLRRPRTEIAGTSTTSFASTGALVESDITVCLSSHPGGWCDNI